MVVQDVGIERSWTHLLPWTHGLCHYTWNNFLRKRLKTSWIAPSQQTKGSLLAWQTTIGRILTTPELLLEEWGVCVPHQALQPLGYQRNEPPKHLSLGGTISALFVYLSIGGHTVSVLLGCLAKASGYALDPAHSHCFAELSCYLTNAGGSMQSTQDAS